MDTYHLVHQCLCAWVRMAKHMLFRTLGEEVFPFLEDKNGLRIILNKSEAKLTLAVQHHDLLNWVVLGEDRHILENFSPWVSHIFTRPFYANCIIVWLGRTLDEIQPWIELLSSQEAQTLYELELLAG